MRRSTAAAVGTVTGAALIMAVRLSVTPQAPAGAPPSFDLSDAGQGAGAGADPTPKPSSRKKGGTESDQTSTGRRPPSDEGGTTASGLRDGRFVGKPVTHPYGTVQVAVTITGGRITSTAVSAPTAGNSGPINAGAVPKLKRETLDAQSAEIDAVSGATYTSQSYVKSLQAALDSARG